MRKNLTLLLLILIFIHLCFASEISNSSDLQLRRGFWGHEYRLGGGDEWRGIGVHGQHLQQVIESDQKAMATFSTYQTWSMANNVLILGGLLAFWSSYQPAGVELGDSPGEIEKVEAKYEYTGLIVALAGGVLRYLFEFPALNDSIKVYNNHIAGRLRPNYFDGEVTFMSYVF